MDNKNINQQMSLEEYKKKVEDCLVSWKNQREQAKNLMMGYEDYIQTAYEEHWDPMNIALPIALGY